MARSRNIKPAFFVNEQLAEVELLGRILFIGLWTIAVREGRLEDRPRKIKVEILPYDECDVDLADSLNLIPDPPTLIPELFKLESGAKSNLGSDSESEVEPEPVAEDLGKIETISWSAFQPVRK